MKTIDIYTTPQCGFCKQLKSELDKAHLVYVAHDVTTDEKAMEEMSQLTDGGMSVPVTVVNKGEETQQVAIGYPDSAKITGLSDQPESSPSPESDTSTESAGSKGSNATATLTCPKCGHKQQGEIPTTSCVPFYVCEGCKETIKASGEDCCVFCSYADTACPLKKDAE